MENNVLKFNNFEKPDDNRLCLIYAPPSRDGYVLKKPSLEKFDGLFLLKERVKKLKLMCDLAFWIVKSTGFGKSVSYSDLTYPNAHYYKDGFVEIKFDNKIGLLGTSFSPTGWEMFQELCLGADRIEIKRRNFNSASIYFYVSDVWVSDDVGFSMRPDLIIQKDEIGEYWDSIKNDDVAHYKGIRRAIMACNEKIKSDEYFTYYHDNIMPFVKNSPVPEELIDKSIFDLTKSDQSVVRDAIISLVMHHGFGDLIYITMVTPENSNRLLSYGYSVWFQNAAIFDGKEKINLFKKIISSSEAFSLHPTDSSGKISISFDVKNIHAK